MKKKAHGQVPTLLTSSLLSFDKRIGQILRGSWALAFVRHVETLSLILREGTCEIEKPKWGIWFGNRNLHGRCHGLVLIHRRHGSFVQPYKPAESTGHIDLRYLHKISIRTEQVPIIIPAEAESRILTVDNLVWSRVRRGIPMVIRCALGRDWLQPPQL